MTAPSTREKAPCRECGSLNTTTVRVLGIEDNFGVPVLRRAKRCRDCGARWETIETDALYAAEPKEA